MYDANLIVLSGQDDSVSFEQIKLPEKKARDQSHDILEPVEDGSAIAHLHSLVNNQLMSDVTFTGTGQLWSFLLSERIESSHKQCL